MPFRDILDTLSCPGMKHAVLEFTPKDTEGFLLTPLADDDTLFFLTKKDNPFRQHKLRFPGLSHA